MKILNSLPWVLIAFILSFDAQAGCNTTMTLSNQSSQKLNLTSEGYSYYQASFPPYLVPTNVWSGPVNAINGGDTNSGQVTYVSDSDPNSKCVFKWDYYCSGIISCTCSGPYVYPTTWVYAGSLKCIASGSSSGKPGMHVTIQDSSTLGGVNKNVKIKNKNKQHIKNKNKNNKVRYQRN